MTSLRSRYRPGSWMSISVPRRWLLVDIEPQHPAVQRLWDAVSAGDGPEDVLDILISEGIRATPSFVLVCLDERGRGFVRGSASLEVSGGASTDRFTGEGRLLWLEVLLDGTADRLTLGSPAAMSELELPMASGVIVAGGLVVSVGSGAVESAADPEPVVQLDKVSSSQATTGPAAATAPAPVQAPALTPAGSDTAPTQSDGEATYDYLFGATVRPDAVARLLSRTEAEPVSDEPSTAEPVAAPDDPGLTAGWRTTAGPSSVPAPVVGSLSAASEPSPSNGVIDVVPWLAAPSTSTPTPTSTATPTSTPTPRALPMDGSAPGPMRGPDPIADPRLVDNGIEGTVNRSALRVGSAAAMGAGPAVLARRCPAGHLTPAHSVQCRVCQQPIADQQPFQVPRPALGLLRLSTGDTVTLDRDVLIGRRPEAPSGGAERPHLIRVNSPEHDVSRQHAEVVLEGWLVYVRDLGSTNGTTVTLPGQSPQRLRENELQLLEHGAVIVLADEIECSFEVVP